MAIGIDVARELRDGSSAFSKEYNALIMQKAEHEACINFQCFLAEYKVVQAEKRQDEQQSLRAEYAALKADEKRMQEQTLQVKQQAEAARKLSANDLQTTLAALGTTEKKMTDLNKTWSDLQSEQLKSSNDWRAQHAQQAQSVLKKINSSKLPLETPQGKKIELTPAKLKQLAEALTPAAPGEIFKVNEALVQNIKEIPETAKQEAFETMSKVGNLMGELNACAHCGGDENAERLTGAALLKAIKNSGKRFGDAAMAAEVKDDKGNPRPLSVGDYHKENAQKVTDAFKTDNLIRENRSEYESAKREHDSLTKTLQGHHSPRPAPGGGRKPA